MTIKEARDRYGDDNKHGYVYCDVCPLPVEKCGVLHREEQGQGRADGREDCWAAIAEYMTPEAPSKREPIAPTQFERDFAEAIKRIDDGAYTTGDVEMCRTALEFIGAARELADRLRTEREAQE